MGNLTAPFTKKSGYWQSSRALTFGLVAIMPLLIGYELLAIWANQGQLVHVRNGADVVLRELLHYIGIHSPFYIGVIIVTIIALLLYGRKIRTRMRLNYFALALIESMAYAVMMALILAPMTARVLALDITGPQRHAQLMLALGAGVYEELVFRAFLFAGSAYILQRALDAGVFIAYLVSAVFSSAIFSLAHYTGGEAFTFYSAVFRFLAGLLLCVIYGLRGLGIAAWSHALYDILLIL